MRYFIHTSGSTLQTPDKLDYIIDGELEANVIEEVGWTWYLSCVKQNQGARDRRYSEDRDPKMWESYIHAKYYGEEYMNTDRIGTQPRHYVSIK